MNQVSEVKQTGCAQMIVVAVSLGWFCLAPSGVMWVLHSALDEMVAPVALAAATVVVTGMLLLLPLAVMVLLTRQRTDWQTTGAVGVGLLIVAGYLLLDATVRAVFSASSFTALYGEGVWAAALRLSLLVPYALLAAWLAPRLAGTPRRSGLPSWLGLHRFDLSTVLVSLTVAALVTISWPVTGALGDSLTSLSLAFQTLAHVIPQVLIFWGVIFHLLASAFDHPRRAAMMTVLLYAAFTLGGVIPTADWSALGEGVFLLPLAFLLTELRAWEGGVYSLIPVFFCYRVVPLLFMDPRDVLVQGMPELQHVLSHTLAIVTVMALDVALWIGRRLLLALRDHVQAPAWAGLAGAALAALLAWGVWGGLSIFAGHPGFANDGFLIILEEQADLSAAYSIPDREARLQYVYETLVETAERTQAPLRAELDALGAPYRPYYAINMIRVDGHRWLMGHFEGRPGVAQVILNPNAREYPHTIPFPDSVSDEPLSGVQSNLASVHADEAWALGVTGEGIVVGGQDTGYDWTHPALKLHYRGWNDHGANHDYNWHDAWDDTDVPFDHDGHGTHTMGTVLGDDGGSNHTGVAPGARWIGCRNMRRGYGNPASYAECVEFFIAPYPHGGDPFADGDVSLAPHVTNNSWGCPYWEGCSAGTLEAAVEALRAAGVMMVVSVGNEGPACDTATMPPANYDAAFSVGATTDGGYIVSFSSRGPADGRVKPDVTAPGESVRSSVPGGGYAYYSGTSMAGPHVAGLAALLWSADPALIGDIDATEALICQTAVPKPVENACTAADEVPEGTFSSLLSNSVCACGDVSGVPNNVYGCGFIDAGAAVQAALEQ